MNKLSNVAILETISSSIHLYQKDLQNFQNNLSSNMNKMKNLQSKCRKDLQEHLSEFKTIFGCLEEELIAGLPVVFQQFLQIFAKVVQAYQQKIQKIEEKNKQWERSYNDLLFSTQKNSLDNSGDEEKVADRILIQEKISEKEKQNSSLDDVSRCFKTVNQFKLKSDESQQLRDITTHQNSVLFKSKELGRNSQQFWNKLSHRIWRYSSASLETTKRVRKSSCDLTLYNKKHEKIMKRLQNYRKNNESLRKFP